LRPEVAAGRGRPFKSLRRAAIGDPSLAPLPADRIDRKQGVSIGDQVRKRRASPVDWTVPIGVILLIGHRHQHE